MKNNITELLRAANFAARAHAGQKRKDAAGTPYINHPLAVAGILADAGISDIATLQAALLHDVVEDTPFTLANLVEFFGAEVAGLVVEVSDDKSLSSAERKALQIKHAPALSPSAKLIKVADKIANVSSLTKDAPVDWNVARKLAFVDQAEAVVKATGIENEYLKAAFDVAKAARRIAFAAETN